MAGTLTLDFSDDGFATIQMVNGENRFQTPVIDEWNKTLDSVLQNQSVRGLLITGTGKFFSNGIDLQWLGQQQAEATGQFMFKLQELMRRILVFPVPTAALINGHAFGGGAFLALACDFRIMRPDRGWLNWPETAIGLRFGEPLLQIARNQDIKGLIITGHEKNFSLGLDVTYFATQTPEYVMNTRTAWGKLYERLLLLPIPTVAAINGHAFGAGAFLAVTCDYLVMNADRGWICWPEVTLEMPLRPQTLELMRLKIPCGKATRDAILFGHKMTGPEALDLHIVEAITDSANLEEIALDLIDKLCRKPRRKFTVLH